MQSKQKEKENPEFTPDFAFKEAIRAYLAEPKSETKKELKKAALALYKASHARAKLKYPDKSIGADEWMDVMDTEFLTPTRDLHLSKDKLQLLDNLVEELRVVDKSDLSQVLYLALLALENKKHLQPFEDKIYSAVYHLKMQAQALIKRGHPQAAAVVLALFHKMDKRTKDYLDQAPNKRQETFEDFKKDLQTFAQEGIDSKELKKHRGVEKVLKNIMLSVSLIGLIYLAATAKKRGGFWLQLDTHSVKKFKAVKEVSELPVEEDLKNVRKREKK